MDVTMDAARWKMAGSRGLRVSLEHEQNMVGPIKGLGKEVDPRLILVLKKIVRNLRGLFFALRVTKDTREGKAGARLALAALFA